MVFVAIAGDDGLDRCIEELHRQHQQQAADQQRALDAALPQPPAQRCQHREQVDLEPERRLVQPGRAQALQRPDGRFEHARRAPRQVPGFVRHRQDPAQRRPPRGGGATGRAPAGPAAWLRPPQGRRDDVNCMRIQRRVQPESCDFATRRRAGPGRPRIAPRGPGCSTGHRPVPGVRMTLPARPAPRPARPRNLAFLAMLAALALLLAACATTAPAPTAWQAPPGLDPVSTSHWETDMARFAAEDARNPPPGQPVVFASSSSFRMWESLARDFPDVPVLNRGFGGSQVRDLIWHAEAVAIRYRPRTVLLYAGENDIDAGRSPGQVLADTQVLVSRLRAALPRASIAWVSIKPSPLRSD